MKKISTKGSKSAARQPKLEVGDCGFYAGLRVALDSFQAMSLHYYAQGASIEDRMKRAAKIAKGIRDILNGLERGPALGCPRGYIDCGGYCIPRGAPCMPRLGYRGQITS